MSLPRFDLPDEETDDDSTAPAQFVLKLPPSYARKLASLQQPPPPVAWPTPSAPWTIETTPAAPAPQLPTKLVAIVASIAVGLLVIAGVGISVTQTTGDGPIGVSKRAPKSLERVVRASARQSGTLTVSVESLQRPHHARRRR